MHFAYVRSKQGAAFLLVGIIPDELPDTTDEPMFGEPFPILHELIELGVPPIVHGIIPIVATDVEQLDAGFAQARFELDLDESERDTYLLDRTVDPAVQAEMEKIFEAVEEESGDKA